MQEGRAMPRPPVITIRGIREKEMIDAEVRKRLEKLRTFCSSIVSARVLVELAERHRRHGNRYRVRIDLTVPGEEIVVAHEAGARPDARARAAGTIRKQDESAREDKDPAIAIRKAFTAAGRRLQDYVRRQRGTVKRHSPAPEGRVVRMFPQKGYGFLAADDGHEVYFHEHSVLGGLFGDLAVGARVTFVEEPGDRGPQASTVRPAS
jgi:cold shock CspA family protein/ribosome-associated translation inhibitor RaiA